MTFVCFYYVHQQQISLWFACAERGEEKQCARWRERAWKLFGGRLFLFYRTECKQADFSTGGRSERRLVVSLLIYNKPLNWCNTHLIRRGAERHGNADAYLSFVETFLWLSAPGVPQTFIEHWFFLFTSFSFSEGLVSLLQFSPRRVKNVLKKVHFL